MTKSNRGYLYALIATICGSLVYLFSKAALNEISLPQFGFWWFLTAIFWNSMMAAHPRGGFSVKSFTRKDYRTLLYIGLIEIVATTSLYAAISVSPNPAIPSFLRNLEYLFVTVFGFVLLRERFGKVALAGAVLTLSGAFIISLRTTSADSFFTAASGLMLLSTSFYAVRTITVKKHIREISPVVLAINRAIFLVLFALIFMIVQKHTFKIPTHVFFIILGGSFIGPFLTSIFQYSALRFIEASRAAIVQSTTGLFVLAGALLIFGNLPTTIQVFGGLVSMAGVSLMMRKRLR
ncbi:MAG: DMT family transporter [Lentimicrobiaceae bacterium]|jgi:drug/metabolite transporter (DMT)-like permease